MRSRRRPQVFSNGFRSILLGLLSLLASAPARAVTCTVPGSHATIQEAIDDPTCTEIDLADQTYPESILVHRSLTITGPGAGMAVLEGRAAVEIPGTLLTLTALEVRNGCQPDAMSVRDAATVEGTDLVVVRSAALPCPPVVSMIFSDGFESGDTSAWSGAVP